MPLYQTKNHHWQKRAHVPWTHLQVGSVASSLVILLLWGWVDPDEAIVAEDHGGTTGQVMEMSLLAFHKGGRDLNQHTLGKLESRPRGSV